MAAFYVVPAVMVSIPRYFASANEFAGQTLSCLLFQNEGQPEEQGSRRLIADRDLDGVVTKLRQVRASEDLFYASLTLKCQPFTDVLAVSIA